MSCLSEARARFVSERSSFVELAKSVEERLVRVTRLAGVPCTVKGRAKDVASFVGKSLRKGYTNPWEEISDKAGVRVTVEDSGDIQRVVDLIQAEYEVIEYQDKTRVLREEEKVGYGGVHLQVSVPDGPVVGGECEIQIRSAAQNLWSEMSHRLLYKPGVEPEGGTRRALTRLAALMEIFDEEVARAMNQITAIPGHHIEELINLAESLFYQYADNTYDRALSRYVLSEIGATLPAERADDYTATLKTFVVENDSKLDGIFRKYADSDEPMLIHQPEAIIIFEQISKNRYKVRDSWDGHLPQDELDQMEAIWGN